MVTVFIPALLRELTGGAHTVRVRAGTVRAAITAIEAAHPGLRARLLRGERLRPGIMAVIDGQQAPDGLDSKLPARCELHFVPALSGGVDRGESDA